MCDSKSKINKWLESDENKKKLAKVVIEAIKKSDEIIAELNEKRKVPKGVLQEPFTI